jgi:hypothetical protein
MSRELGNLNHPGRLEMTLPSAHDWRTTEALAAIPSANPFVIKRAEVDWLVLANSYCGVSTVLIPCGDTERTQAFASWRTPVCARFQLSNPDVFVEIAATLRQWWRL